MTQITAAELIEIHRQFVIADQKHMAERPAGMNRTAWRDQNQYAMSPIEVHSNGQPHIIRMDTAHNSREARVWRVAGDNYPLVEAIDLTAADADERLAKYRKNGSQ